jgi:hypothetical protein
MNTPRIHFITKKSFFVSSTRPLHTKPCTAHLSLYRPVVGTWRMAKRTQDMPFLLRAIRALALAMCIRSAVVAKKTTRFPAIDQDRTGASGSLRNPMKEFVARRRHLGAYSSEAVSRSSGRQIGMGNESRFWQRRGVDITVMTCNAGETTGGRRQYISFGR